MLNTKDLEEKVWWGDIDEDIKELMIESLVLVEEAVEWKSKFIDYSFIVFPAAKAYEGFLKKFLLSVGLIGKDDYYGKHFRIGKALNPDLDVQFRNDDWVYGRLSKYCGGEGVPKKLWETWKTSRNLVFHWFPEEKNTVSFDEAQGRVEMVYSAIDEVYESCILPRRKNGGS